MEEAVQEQQAFCGDDPATITIEVVSYYKKKKKTKITISTIPWFHMHTVMSYLTR